MGVPFVATIRAVLGMVIRVVPSFLSKRCGILRLDSDWIVEDIRIRPSDATALEMICTRKSVETLPGCQCDRRVIQLTGRHRKKREGDDRRQLREQILPTDFLTEPSRQLDLDAAIGCGGVPVALHDDTVVPSRPAQVQRGSDSVSVDSSTGGCDPVSNMHFSISGKAFETYKSPAARSNQPDKAAPYGSLQSAPRTHIYRQSH